MISFANGVALRALGTMAWDAALRKGMLVVDGSRLTRRATNILGNKLAGLVSRALN